MELDGKAKNYQSIHNTLDCYNSKEKLLMMFAALQHHYFHFKRYVMDQRKDRCPDRILFRFNLPQQIVKPEHPDNLTERTPDSHLLMLIKQLRMYLLTADSPEARIKATDLLRILEKVQLRQEIFLRGFR